MTLEAREDTAAQIAEIEAALNRLPQVSEAVVLVRRGGTAEQRLVAYVVSEGPFNSPRLYAELASKLPPGAMPAAIVPVSSLPLTPLGRVDEEVLFRLEVINSASVKEWEEQLRSVPGIDQVAVVAQEENQSVSPLHLSDLLPDWNAFPARETGHPKSPTARAQIAREVSGLQPLSISHGERLREDEDFPTTLPRALERATRRSPGKGVVYVQPDATEVAQSYPELLEEAERILAGLRNLGLEPQDKILMQLDRCRDFIPAFWACQLGGFIPVPLSVAPTYATMNSSVSKLQNAWRMLERPVILTDRALTSAIQSLSSQSNFENLRVVSIDDCRLCEPDRSRHKSHPDDVAMLLLTSGSTGQPKAVMQSHLSLVSRSAGTSQLNNFSSQDISLNWMPLDHVGGIVMFHVRDVYLACQQIHVSTDLILQDPLKWLDLIERFRATVTWAPNFAFGLVNTKVEAMPQRHWDLTSMRFILNGGEAIVAKTARRFLSLLRSHGLSGSCMHPAWGMSETSSGVVYSDEFSVDTTSDSDSFVEVGAPIPGFSMRIVDEHGRLVPEGSIGRLQVIGASVTSGYYRNPELTKQAFSTDGWFETGDLGYLRRGRLTITGREKDVIIVNGVNYYSHEIEAVAEEVPGVVISYTAACSVRSAGTDTDKLAVFFHPSSNDDIAVAGLMKEIRENVVKKIGINPDYLIPVEEAAIPKTAIGKIQRTQLSQRFKDGEFESVLKRVDVLGNYANTIPAWFYGKVWRRKEQPVRREQQPTHSALVFLDSFGLGQRLCDEMDRREWPNVRVEAGEGFGKLGPNRYQIDPRQPDDYWRLLASIAAEGSRVDRVFHLWTFGPSTESVTTVEQLERSQDYGVYSLLFLVQALDRQREGGASIRLLFVSTNSQSVLKGDDVQCGYGSVFGLLKTVPQELPWLDCRHLDIADDDATRIVARVLDEASAATRDQEVAFRNGERWVPRLKRVNFTKQRQRELPFKRGGTYVLSGGLGGVGTEIARCLLQQYEARLLIVGRTPMATASALNMDARIADVPDHVQALRELNQLPGQVHYEHVDVGDFDGLQQAAARARSRWNCDLDGAIHLAGIYLERPLTEETRESFAQVLRAKVLGTWNLSRLLGDKPGSVLVSFSSLSGQFGGALTGAYSAANSFLEAFTHFRRSKISNRTHCIAWSTWDDLGMSRGYAMKDLARGRGYMAISKTQGLNSFLGAMSCGEPLVLVGLDGSNAQVRRQVNHDSNRAQKACVYFTTLTSSAPIEQLRALSVYDGFGTKVGCDFRQLDQMPLTEEGEIDRDRLAQLGRRGDQAANKRNAPQTDLERRLAGFWQDVLGVAHISVHDNFFDLGGNSLRATQVASRIEEAFRLRMPLRTMLEESTLAKLALAVRHRLEKVPATSAPAIAKAGALDAKKALENLDQLSDEEVSALLSQTMARSNRQ